MEDYVEERFSQLSTQTVAKNPEKNSGLNGIRTHDLCDAGAALYQLSYQAMVEHCTGIAGVMGSNPLQA